LVTNGVKRKMMTGKMEKETGPFQKPDQKRRKGETGARRSGVLLGERISGEERQSGKAKSGRRPKGRSRLAPWSKTQRIHKRGSNGAVGQKQNTSNGKKKGNPTPLQKNLYICAETGGNREAQGGGARAAVTKDGGENRKKAQRWVGKSTEKENCHNLE